MKLTCCGKLRLRSRQGDDAIQDLRGPPIENSNLDRLKLPTPGMDCGIARSLIFVSCHSASFNNKKEAEALFTRIIDDGQAALPSDSWRQVEAVPHTGLIRTISYHIGSPARKSTSTWWFNPQGKHKLCTA